MLEIRLLDVLRTARFGPVGLGASRREVYNRLGKPDGWSDPDAMWSRKATIWLYGDIELHFAEEDDGRFTVWMIWCDYIPLPGRESESVQLDPWVFAGPGPVTMRAVEHALRAEGIAYEVASHDRPYGHEQELALESGVRLGVGQKEDPTQKGVVGFIHIDVRYQDDD